jgi:hypothetical protein
MFLSLSMEMEVIVVFSIVKNVVGHMGVKLQFQVFHEQQCVEKGDATAKTIVQKSRRIYTRPYGTGSLIRDRS